MPEVQESQLGQTKEKGQEEMNSTISENYNDVEVTYQETENVWRCELRGRERTFPSLAKAKQAIDKPEPSEKAPFTRVKGWIQQYNLFKRVEVTSIAEMPRYSTGIYVWCVIDGARQKQRADNIYADTEDTRNLIEQYNKLAVELVKTRAHMEATEKKMARIKV